VKPTTSFKSAKQVPKKQAVVPNGPVSSSALPPSSAAAPPPPRKEAPVPPVVQKEVMLKNVQVLEEDGPVADAAHSCTATVLARQGQALQMFEPRPRNNGAAAPRDPAPAPAPAPALAPVLAPVPAAPTFEINDHFYKKMADSSKAAAKALFDLHSLQEEMRKKLNITPVAMKALYEMNDIPASQYDKPGGVVFPAPDSASYDWRRKLFVDQYSRRFTDVGGIMQVSRMDGKFVSDEWVDDFQQRCDACGDPALFQDGMASIADVLNVPRSTLFKGMRNKVKVELQGGGQAGIPAGIQARVQADVKVEK
jgi:hypothetical protein